MKKLNLIIGITLLVSSLLFNVWLYRAEPTVRIDPNDNAFQYALVDRTNEIWDFANKHCTPSFQISNPPAGEAGFKFQIVCKLSYLIDHWVPNWAEGYNLPTYYSHIPQILIVGSYRMITSISQIPIFNFQFSNNFSNFEFQISNYSLFNHYHLIIYLLLCFFPLSIFLALKVLKQSWLTAGIGAVLAVLISTDGMYGLDPTSYLWRGWGLSSQLFGAIFLPLTVAFSVKACEEKARKIHLLLAVFFLTCTTAGHLGLGLMAFLSLPVITFTPALLSLLHCESIKTIWANLLVGLGNMLKLAIPPLVILSYWIIPTVTGGNFHNMSFWDPIWKFDSYGAREILTNLFNGHLFDFERFPLVTILVGIGIFVGLLSRTNAIVTPLPFLFLFFLFLYFGRTTWGNIINLIPSMSDFHQHRFIVGVNLAGLLLAPIGFTWFIEIISKWIISKIQMKRASHIFYFLFFIFTFLTCLILLPRTLSYGRYNEELIRKSNEKFDAMESDARLLIETLKGLPRGRVFAGRGGGGWGKDFKIGGVAAYMYLSTYGIPTILWMPETWSPSTDTEQSFIEHDITHYDLFDVHYVVTPAQMPEGNTIQPFWMLTKETTTWKLYTIDVSGAVVTGTAPSIVYSDKYSYKNLVRLWIQEPTKGKYIYPELRIRNYEPGTSQSDALPWFSMIDSTTYRTPDGKVQALFEQPPKYMTPWEWPQAFPEYQIDNAKIINNISKSTTNDLELRNSKLEIPIVVLSQSSDTDMVFRATVKIDGFASTQKLPARIATQSVAGGRTKNEASVVCPTCVVILKHTYSPNWKATVHKISEDRNPEPVQSIIVFPFYTAVRLEKPGTYDIVFTYTPSRLKMMLLFLPIVGLGIFFWRSIVSKRHSS